MYMSLNTDLTSTYAHRSMEYSGNDMRDVLENLSSGVKIKSASDDAANLTLSKQLESIQSGINTANINIQTGLTKVQTYENNLSSITDNFQRIRDLATQSANGVYSDAERSMLNEQAQALMEEINQTIKVAHSDFAITLADDDVEMQIGERNDAESFYTMENMAIDLTGHTVDLTTIADSRTAMDEIDNLIDMMSEKRSQIGTHITNLEGIIQLNNIRHDGIMNSVSSIRDTDMAEASTELAKTQITQQAATSIFQQAQNIRANSILGLY